MSVSLTLIITGIAMCKIAVAFDEPPTGKFIHTLEEWNVALWLGLPVQTRWPARPERPGALN
jgi:hypothetical protein